MAKTGKNLQQIKEQQFDELIQKNWYYNDVYTYLLKFENEFTNLSLMDFILNCESAENIVFGALLNPTNNKDLTIKYIIEQKGYYETALKPDCKTNNKLNDFELYLTKFIIAHCLVRYYKEDKKRNDYFNQVLSISERQKLDFKYYAHSNYTKFSLYVNSNIEQDWLLKLNTKQYVTIDKKELAETLNKLKQTTTQPTPPQKEIEYINTSKIDWKKDERLIPYLIHLLNENGFIKEKNQFAFIEKHFTVNSKPIKRENIKANYNQADYLNKSINKSPKEIKQINDFIEQLNSILNALE